MGDTAIEWTDKTWNPTVGCTRHSQGCKNCYAFNIHDMRHAAHKAGKKVPKQYAKPFTELQMIEDRLDDPLHWRKPCRVFVNSMSDLFHEDIPDEFIDRVFAVMALARRHVFQILTKRADRLARYFAGRSFNDVILNVLGEFDSGPSKQSPPSWLNLFQTVYRVTEAESAMGKEWPSRLPQAWPLPNVWLGVSVEDQPNADKRIPDLLRTPAAVRFLSVEPMLGPIDFDEFFWSDQYSRTVPPARYLREVQPNWVIVGGESGPDARQFDVAWARSVRDQCKEAGIPCFIKQLGGNIVWNGIQGGYMDGVPNVWPNKANDELVSSTKWRIRLKDRKGGDMEEWPADLRVREFPATV